MNIILDDKSLISARVALLTMAGLPSIKKSESLAVKLLEKQFKMKHEDLMRIAGIKEEEKEFCLFELRAVKDEGTENWQWYQFTKRSGYLSCFVSALESGKVQTRGKSFAPQPRRQYMFDNEALDNCFHNVYQLLSAFYNDTSADNSRRSISTAKLAGNATLSLVNVWDIGFNRTILHFLTLLGGYLHHNFPILTLTYPDDAENLTELLDISKNELLKGLQPILDQYSRAKFLLTFSHLGRSSKRQHKRVCQVVSTLNADKKPQRDQHKKISEELKDKISKEAKELGVEDLIHGCPWIVDQDSDEDLDTLKNNLDGLISGEQQNKIPLSWFFLRSAFFKTGQLYIETSKLEQHARKCRITAEQFKQFLSRFTGFGSIIHIPDIPVLCNYVILNPPDFFHKLTELFYPRFNGDLQYGIASFSTLRRLFGEDLQFFLDVLTSCSFAVEIISNRIVYADEKSRLPIAEPCLYIPGMRTEVASEDDRQIRKDSLLLFYKNALLPTHTTENVVKYLLQSSNMANLCLVTCDCYTITRFEYYSHLTQNLSTPSTPCSPPDVEKQPLSEQDAASDPPKVSITMISHGDKNEIRIEGDKEIATDIKKEVVRAYRYADKVYSDNQQKLLDIESEFEFAFVCQVNPNEHHTIAGDTACPECCGKEEAFKRMWDMWRQVFLETREC